MTRVLSRWILALAVQSLGAHRRAWAEAMVGELDAAQDDRRPLRFALGCLAAAWRTLPQHREGRSALARYGVAFGLFLPVSAVLLLAALYGLPFVEGRGGLAGLISGSGPDGSLLNAGSQAIAPALTLAMLQLAACHVPLAWWVLEQDWRRVATTACIGAATMTTLLLVTACAALNVAAILQPALVLAFELAAVTVLARWHAAHDFLQEGC
ncbi:hypothetical protein [uncultured Sphingomonas sp.]|uniref:hypothetical protein n=1 Tax=uncultured Sphingomonas sp. TaxID=158754 RepID=UPI0025EF42F4|nr:hypothetical protein [uncultured Sphingomonas sp.]